MSDIFFKKSRKDSRRKIWKHWEFALSPIITFLIVGCISVSLVDILSNLEITDYEQCSSGTCASLLTVFL